MAVTGTVLAMTFRISTEMTVGARPSSAHGPKSQRMATEEGVLELSIFETGLPPRFRLSAVMADTITVQSCREGDKRQDFRFGKRTFFMTALDSSERFWQHPVL
jgi:hypothetical protein